MTAKNSTPHRLHIEPIVRANAERIATWRSEGKPLLLIGEILSKEYKVTITDRHIINGLNRHKWGKNKQQATPVRPALKPAFRKTARAGPKENEPEPGRKTVKWNPNPDLKDFI